MRLVVIKIIIIGIIAVGAIGASLYIFRSQKTVSPISKPQENTKIVIENQPSKTLKDYTDDAGFSFKYPEDVVVTKKDANDPNAYSHLELTSDQTKGSISIKITDSKFKSVDDWFRQNKLIQSLRNKKEIKIGEISGSEIQVDNKLLAAALNQEVLFTIEVDSQNQKYWLSVYENMLSTFDFVPKTTSDTVDQPLDDSNADAVLEEETIE